jgi:CHAD domain-containing protein
VIEFHPPVGMTMAQAAGGLADALAVRQRPERTRERSYYDTFDGRLHAEGLELVFEAGDLVLSDGDSGSPRARATMARPRRPLLVSSLAPGELRSALEEVIGVRALLSLARLRCRERAIDVLDDQRKTVARMTLSAPAVHVADAPAQALAPRLVVNGLRGYDDELSHVCSVLCEQLFFTPAEQTLADAAVLASGGVPGGVSSRVLVALGVQQSAASAVTAMLRAQLEIIEANLPGTLEDTDSEFLHDFRVAIRRTRAVQREAEDVFAPEGLAHFRGEFRWLQQVTGDARDMDVYRLGFEELRGLVAAPLRADLDPLLAVLRARHRRAHAAMNRALRSDRATSLPDAWRAFLVELEAGEGGPAAQTAIAEVAGRRIRTVYRQMVRMGAAIAADTPPEEYHELRKKGKELRYLLELFATPLYPHEVVKPLVKTLKALQDVLGRHQDRYVQAATLRSLQDEVARGPGGVSALVAIGALIQRLAEDEQDARAEFKQHFAPFAAREQRRLVRETFS